MAINKKNTNTVKDTTSTKKVIKVNAYETEVMAEKYRKLYEENLQSS